MELYYAPESKRAPGSARSQAIISDDPDARLTRDAAAEALTKAGFPVRKATLATLATRGGGPRYQKFGTRPIYRWADLVTWANARLGPVVCSTSEADAA
jgi:hypothetical protein